MNCKICDKETGGVDLCHMCRDGELPPTTDTVEAGGAHYGSGLQPWDLQRHMPSWGSVFLDARRTDVIEYMFRKKGDMEKWLDDAKKCKHNLEVIIKELEERIETGPF